MIWACCCVDLHCSDVSQTPGALAFSTFNTSPATMTSTSYTFNADSLTAQLPKHRYFASPAKAYLQNTISTFLVMSHEVCGLYRPCWCSLHIQNLPRAAAKHAAPFCTSKAQGMLRQALCALNLWLVMQVAARREGVKLGLSCRHSARSAPSTALSLQSGSACTGTAGRSKHQPS